MTSTDLYIPLTEIKVSFRASSQRPITELDLMIMEAISAGASSVEDLRSIFHLPERLLVECLVDLMDLGLLALDRSGCGFRLTEYGERGVEHGLSVFGEQLDDADDEWFIREDLDGRIALRTLIRYDREKGTVRSATGASSISYGEIEQILVQRLQKEGKSLHSLDRIEVVRDGISLRVIVDNGFLSGLPNQWSHLKPVLLAKAERITGKRCSRVEQKCEEDVEDASLWSDVVIGASDLLLTTSDHQQSITTAILEAHSRLLVLSAHVSREQLEKLKEPIKAAINRGVRVDILWGLPSREEGGEPYAKMMGKWSQEMRRLFPDGKGDLLQVNEAPFDCDAKLLIWDTELGSFEGVVGSYNWLYGLSGANAELPGSEVGIRLKAPRLIASICTTLSGWLEGRGQYLSGIALRWRNIGLELSHRSDPAALHELRDPPKARIIYDEDHAVVLREALVNATKRLLVTSHKINRSATGHHEHGGGKLDWLATKSPNPELELVLVTGGRPKQEFWASEDEKRLEKLVRKSGGSCHLGVGTHGRVIVYDDIAVVSGYNFLSTTHDKRQVGLIVKDLGIADTLWSAFNRGTD